ncbi:hypothetical protein ACG3RN_08580, partial [Pseudomonas aeruginosa]
MRTFFECVGYLGEALFKASAESADNKTFLKVTVNFSSRFWQRATQGQAQRVACAWRMPLSGS